MAAAAAFSSSQGKKFHLANNGAVSSQQAHSSEEEERAFAAAVMALQSWKKEKISLGQQEKVRGGERVERERVGSRPTTLLSQRPTTKLAFKKEEQTCPVAMVVDEKEKDF